MLEILLILIGIVIGLFINHKIKRYEPFKYKPKIENSSKYECSKCHNPVEKLSGSGYDKQYYCSVCKKVMTS